MPDQLTLDAPAMAPATIDADAEFASWAVVPASTAVATIEEAPAPAVIQEPQSIPERVLALAALQPGVNPEMFDRLVAWQEREQARQAEEAFNAAMNAAQAEIMPVARTAENSQTKSFYAKLEAVDAAIRPIYLRHGFNVAYGTVPPLVPGNIRVECEVSLGRHSKKVLPRGAGRHARAEGRRGQDGAARWRLDRNIPETVCGLRRVQRSVSRPGR